MSTFGDFGLSKLEKDPGGFYRGDNAEGGFLSSVDMTWWFSKLSAQKEAALIISGTDSISFLDYCCNAFARIVLEVSDENTAQRVAKQFVNKRQLSVVLGAATELTGTAHYLRFLKECPAENVAKLLYYYDVPEGISALLQADFAESKPAKHFIEELGFDPSFYISTSLDIPFRGVYMSKQRPLRFRSIAFIEKTDSGKLLVKKEPCAIDERHSQAAIQIQSCSSEWITNSSLEQLVLQNISERPDLSLAAHSEIVKPWLQALYEVATEDKRVPASLFDACWNNCFFEQGRVTFIDQEWQAAAPLPIKYIVIRSIFQFLIRNENSLQDSYQEEYRNFHTSITFIAAALGCTLSASDFAMFEQMESKIQACIMDKPQLLFRLKLKLRLRFPACYRLLRSSTFRIRSAFSDMSL